jgi:hypothetical protein
MTSQEFRNLFTMLLAAWTTQRQKMSNDDVRGMAAIYTAGLADLDAGIVRDAVQRLVRTSVYMPTVAEIRQAAGVVIHGQQDTGVDQWGSVVRAIREQGMYKQPGADFKFNDPITDRVVRALNWRELCASDHAAAVADRARFIDAYNQIAKLERTEAQANDGAVSNVLPIRRSERTESLGSLVQNLLPDSNSPA